MLNIDHLETTSPMERNLVVEEESPGSTTEYRLWWDQNMAMSPSRLQLLRNLPSLTDIAAPIVKEDEIK